MSKESKSTGNRQIKLRIAISLWDALINELDFLGIHCRIVCIEERELKSRNDFLRLVTEQYCARFFGNYQEPYDTGDEDSKEITFYLDNHSRGLWSTALKDGAGSSFSQLVNSALHDYFERQILLGEASAARLEILKQKLRNPDLAELRELIAV